MERFAEIFDGLKRAHGCTYINTKPANGEKLKTKSFVKREPVTLEHYKNHLKGVEPTLGIIPITDDNTCIWGCIDVDSYAGFDHKKLLKKIKIQNFHWSYADLKVEEHTSFYFQKHL